MPVSRQTAATLVGQRRWVCLRVPPDIKVPELSLVVLIGASGSGKSTLARRLFKPTEILSSDTCRWWVSDDDNNQEATGDAFDVLHYVARKRLARGLLTVVDATNVRAEDRKPLVQLAREFHTLPVAIVVDKHRSLCRANSRGRLSDASDTQTPRDRFVAHCDFRTCRPRRSIRQGISALLLERLRRRRPQTRPVPFPRQRGSPCAACTSACSPSWRWRANP